jgi:hypothetical protein
MSETPSARRRKGREAYYRGGDPNALNPYHEPYFRMDWREGWDRAQREDEIVAEEEREVEKRRMEPIAWAIDRAETDDDVKEILRRITEHVGMH